jgi:branched-chain amino acid transport system ATP-binding protein
VTSSAPFFSGEGITLRFGGVTALHDVAFSVAAGTVHAMIGPNGAGKTSLFNVITGFYAPDAGTVLLDGETLSGRPPHAIAQRGIVRTFQNLEIFTNMTVLENVLTGAHLSGKYGPLDFFLRTPRYFREERRLRDEAMAELDFVGLAGEAALPAGQLPFGSQRLLEIARALAARPRLLLLDEPAAGLNIRETAALGALIRRIVTRGVTVLMVEHDMALVMDISDRVLVLNYGEVLAEGTPVEVQRNPAVVAAYLGEEA